MEDLQLNKFEYISPDKLRLDGRRIHELRTIKFRLNIFTKADGCCYYQQGNTKVLVSIYGPREPEKRSDKLDDRCSVKCIYSIAKFSTGQRKHRLDKLEKESALVVRQVFEKVIRTKLYPMSEIKILVKILEDDGSVLPCALNASSLALIDAGIPLKDFLVCCSTGLLENNIVCDTNHVEQSYGGAQLNVGILPNLDKKISVILSRELNKKSISLNDFEKLLKSAIEGCEILHEILKKKLKKRTKLALEKRILK